MLFAIKCYIEPSGQRNAVIVERETGFPVFWPTHYTTSQLRARGSSLSTLLSQLRAITYLYHWSVMRSIDLEARIVSAKGFSRNEIDTLVSMLRSRMSDLPNSTGTPTKVTSLTSLKAKNANIWQALEERPRQIHPKSYNDRLDYVGRYVFWLSDYLSDSSEPPSCKQPDLITEVGVRFKEQLIHLKSIEPNTHFENSKSLSAAETRSILELVAPNSHLNPWSEIQTQIRNFAIVLVLLDTGLRSGELLSLKIKDIIFAKKGSKGLKVVRRQGSKDDPRLNQPSTKRSEREVPLSESAYQALDLYVTSVRNKIPKAARTEYLFVSLSNNHTGMPLASITAITDKIRDMTGIDLFPHKLRHTATWRYCITQKKQGRKWADFVEQLISKFGWSSEKSPSVRHYAKRFIKEQMFERHIRDQDELNNEMQTALNTVKRELEHAQ